MRFIRTILIVPLLFGAQFLQAQIPEVIFTEPVLTFGADNLPEEYLIVNGGFPIWYSNIAVDTDDNIYYYEENRVKVYDKNGKPKAIIGSPGQGPGEFNTSGGFYKGLITIGPEGFVTVINEGLDVRYNVYDPQYNFLKIVFKRTRNRREYSCKVFAINENEFIGKTFETEINGDQLVTTFNIEHQKDDASNVIASYDVITHFVEGRDQISIPFTGGLKWGLIPGGKVCYTHTRHDEEYTQNGSYYVLHVHDIESGQVTDYKFEFDPVALTDKDFERPRMKNRLRGAEELRKRTENISVKADDFSKNRENQNRPAVSLIVFDGNIAYAFTYKIENRKCLVHILDLEKGKLLKQVYMKAFNINNGVSINYYIKNGHAYWFDMNEEGFPVMKKFIINPAISWK